ncbi:MAG: exonuclease domain-containing protein [Bacteroidales bacterium]|nr:exonuclease domain-containing protein [Bacteroidales bacterium]MDZ4203275.1 exonuclease domain-containing protein [Bacteroidales bacterium]
MKLKLTRPLAVIDLETTGVNVGSDRIVEICILKVWPDGNREIRTQRVNPGIPIPPAVVAIHGISDEDVKDEPTFTELAPQLVQMLSNCDLCGYNALKFDIPMLVEEFLRADVEFEIKGRRMVDVQNIFHKMEPRNLKAAFRFYCSKDLINAHSAEADTLATFEILEAQLDRYEDVAYSNSDGLVSYPVANDVNALHRFSVYHKFCDLAGHIIFDDKNNEVFNFGKYKGRLVEEVFRIEPSYYDWMMKSQFPLYTKKVITSIKLRGFNKGSASSR